MTRTNTLNFRLIPMLIGMFMILIGFCFSALCHAEQPSFPGVQLAYFIGYHDNGMVEYSIESQGVYIAPYIAPYRYHGQSNKHTRTKIKQACKKTCVLDRWTGKVLQGVLHC